MPSKPDDYLTDHAVACGEIGELSWLLSEVVRLDDVAGGMTITGLRAEVRRIARQARDHPSVQKRGETGA